MLEIWKNQEIRNSISQVISLACTCADDLKAEIYISMLARRPKIPALDITQIKLIEKQYDDAV